MTNCTTREQQIRQYTSIYWDNNLKSKQAAQLKIYKSDDKLHN